MFSSRCFSATTAGGAASRNISLSVGFGLLGGLYEVGECFFSTHPVC